MTETNTVIANISEVVSKEYEGQPTRLKLELTEDNMFTGKTETSSVALTESETNEGKDFKRDKLEKAFKRISDYTGVELEVPKSISKTSVATALKPVKGKSLEVYVGTGTSKNDEGIEDGHFTYHSLYEPSDGFDYVTASSKISELMALDDRFKEGTVFTVRPVGFQGEMNTKYFQDSKPHDAEMIEETNTRVGFARTLYKILKGDDSEESQKIRTRLEKYIKQNTIDDDFLGTTGGIIQQVGIFSDQSKRAKHLDDVTVLNLEKTLSSNKHSGRAYTGTVRLVFSVDGLDGHTFRTRPLKEAKIPRSETFVTTFNPKDTNFMEYAKFTEPLYRMGALTMDDLEEIKGMDKWFDIMNKIYEIIEREGLVAKVSIDSVGGSNHFAHLVGFEYDDGQTKGVEKEGDPLKQEATKQASQEEVATEPKQDTPQKESVASTDEVANNNPFVKEDGTPIDIDESDLPF